MIVREHGGRTYSLGNQERAEAKHPAVQRLDPGIVERQLQPEVPPHPAAQEFDALMPHLHEIVEILPGLRLRQVAFRLLVRHVVERIVPQGRLHTPLRPKVPGTSHFRRLMDPWERTTVDPVGGSDRLGSRESIVMRTTFGANPQKQEFLAKKPQLLRRRVGFAAFRAHSHRRHSQYHLCRRGQARCPAWRQLSGHRDIFTPSRPCNSVVDAELVDLEETTGIRNSIKRCTPSHYFGPMEPHLTRAKIVLARSRRSAQSIWRLVLTARPMLSAERKLLDASLYKGLSASDNRPHGFRDALRRRQTPPPKQAAPRQGNQTAKARAMALRQSGSLSRNSSVPASMSQSR